MGDFLKYYVANGNSVEGFGELRDRSGIEVDENNVSQQEAIVREDVYKRQSTNRTTSSRI